MAYNFLLETRAWEALTRGEKKRFPAVFGQMDGSFELKRGEQQQIAESIGGSTNRSTISTDAGVIQDIVSVLKGGADAKKRLNDIVESGARGRGHSLRALEILESVDFTWEDAERRMREHDASGEAKEEDALGEELIPPASIISTDILNRPEIVALLYWLSDLVEENKQREKEMRILREILRQRERTMHELGKKLGALARPLIDSSNEDGKEGERMEISWEDALILEYELPKMATGFGREPLTIEYTGACIRSFEALHPDHKRSFVERIAKLAAEGSRATKEQRHKKYPATRNGIPAPAGCYVSKVTKSLRFLWELVVGQEGKRELVVYYIGTHAEVWSSEA